MGGETTRVCGTKRLALKIEVKRLGGKRPGGNVLGRNVLLPLFVPEFSCWVLIRTVLIILHDLPIKRFANSYTWLP